LLSTASASTPSPKRRRRLAHCCTAPRWSFLRRAAPVSPKVVIGHQRLADKLAVLDPLLKIRSDDVALLPLQLTFIFGLWVSLLALSKGARLILVPKFSSEAMTRGLAEATVLAGVPSMFRTLLSYPAMAAPKLRAILTGGEVLPRSLARGLLEFAPVTIHDLYGLTETGSCDFCLAPADQPQGFGTIGRPTDRVDFRLQRDGCKVSAGETGELQIRTPFGMLGYLDNPELTAASFEGDYFRTGDLARITDGGYVALIGRAKDIISRGGNKIAPLEIDNLLAEHPGVAAALCAGVPDERLGEVVHAVVVPRAGVKIDTTSLRDWLMARTERFGCFLYPRCAAERGERQGRSAGDRAACGGCGQTALTIRLRPRR
jgi:long-chain acyl-CoA synthetase